MSQGGSESSIERLARLIDDKRAAEPSFLAKHSPFRHDGELAVEHSPARQTVSIDLARLEAAGMVTPRGGRDRVLDEYRIIKRPILRNAAFVPEVTPSRRNLVMVTSAHSGEGKTFTAISLAMSVVAEQDTQVLLVDLDLAKQQLCQTLGVRSDKGFINLLGEPQLTLSDVVVSTDVPRLAVLPGGADHPLAHEFLAGHWTRNVMDEISSRFRDGLVIIDSAPILSSTHPSVLATSVGQVIMVVEANQTSRPSLEEAMSLIDGCEQISFVLNKVAMSELTDQYGSYGYGLPER